MAEPEVEAAWRGEFKRSGATQLRDALNSGDGFTDELKRQAAFRWLGDEADPQRLQQEQVPVCAAIKQHKIACFYLAGGSSPVWDKLHCLMRGLQGIKRCIEIRKPPFIFDVALNGRLTEKRIP